MLEYTGSLKKRNINISYSGPMWEDGLKGIAEMVKSSLSSDELPSSAAKSIFSVFIEQATNMLMYSAEKEHYPKHDAESSDVSTGMLVLGHKNLTYFIQTGNVVKSVNAELIKGRLDYLNTLDKKGIRQFYREQMRGENDNPESQGAGLGFIEIAKRATAPIKYDFEPLGEGLFYFTMYVEIGQEVA